MLTPKCIVEIQELTDRAARLSRGDVNDRAESAALLSRAKTLRDCGESSDELRAKYATQTLTDAKTAAGNTSEDRYRQCFERYILTGDERALEPQERRDLLAGSQSITYSAGAAGGYAVPWQYSSVLWKSLAQTDPLLDPEVCDFEIGTSFKLQPKQISGYDLSTITATEISETAQQTAGTFPAVSGAKLRSFTYRLTLNASFEAETDVPGTLAKMAQAYGVGFARKLGQVAVNGNGISEGQGIAVALTPSYTTTYTQEIIEQDLNNIYFGLNRVYRGSPFCAWLMSDSVYERVRKAVDSANRPLLNMEHDEETILGKPVYITPSLGIAGGSPATDSTIIFGALDHFHARASAATMQRALNTPNTIEFGRAMYIARIRFDCTYFDPSNGSAPPIISAVVQG
jgi:HK97 family phage major capsid protein